MKKLFCLWALACSGFALQAQITSSPALPNSDSPVTITYDATQGNAALVGATSVYMYSAAVLVPNGTGANWTHVVGNYSTPSAVAKSQMTKIATNKWQITITPRSYFNVGIDTAIYRIGMIFRTGTGGSDALTGRGSNTSTDNGNIYLDLVQPGAFSVSFTAPTATQLVQNAGDNIPTSAVCTASATLTLYNNGTQVTQVTNATTLSSSITVGAAGTGGIVKVVATSGPNTAVDSFSYVARPTTAAQDPPAGTQDGITYLSTTSARLSLYAPYRKYIYVLGDFNNWQVNNTYYMKRSVDGSRYWLDITGLTAGKEYAFQYFIDDSLAVADAYADKILDPDNDTFVVKSGVYPGLKPYPKGKATGIVSVLQPGQTAYTWTASGYVRPAATKLVIYELLVRDFVSTHSYQTLIDTFNYFKRLGVNAIELMPLMEFTGNDSWGYNPIFYFAPDKYYGTKDKLKQFIDLAHQNGIAVIMDMVLNQADYECPLVKMYWDPVNNRPAANNPWFNTSAPHPYSVFFDFNHASVHTQQFVDRVTAYWLQQYKIDGFRFDLAKGFTNKVTINGNGGSCNSDCYVSQYDTQRVHLLTRMTTQLHTVDPSAYSILELFSNNDEQDTLTRRGMLTWNNLNSNFKQCALGFPSDAGSSTDLSNASYKTLGYTTPHAITYMESHDEEREMYNQEQFGNFNGSYNTKTIPTALDRMKAIAAFLFTIPGPKLMWEFGEQGYDITINANGGRTNAKPPHWEYLQDTNRLKLYYVYAALIKLATTNPAFQTTNFSLDVSGQLKRINLNDASMNVTVIGNFGVSQTKASVNPNFQSTGKWYDYFSGDSLNVTNTTLAIQLFPGEFHIYTSKKLPKPSSGTASTNLVPAGWGAGVITANEVSFAGSSLTVYPVPTSSNLNVAFSDDTRGAVQVQLYDLSGRVVYDQSFDKFGQDFTASLSVGSLPSAIYIVKVVSNGQSASRRIVKN